MAWQRKADLGGESGLSPEKVKSKKAKRARSGKGGQSDPGLAGIVERLDLLQSCVRPLLRRVTSLEAKTRLQGKLLRLMADDLMVSVSARHADEKRLFGANAQVYSQNYEDAMIGEIFSRIGFGSRRFVEVGVEDGMENCTRLLLEHCGFSGVWIEMDPEACARIRRVFARHIADGRLHLVEGKATAENINDLIPSDFRDVDLLSLDVDQNTTHVWRALDLKARVACIEYNAAFPPTLDIETPYEAETVWDGGHIYGGSLKAIERIGDGKAMRLVGCDLHGVNALLVADSEDLSKFRAPFTAENHFEPLRLEQVHLRGHTRRERL